MIRGAVYKIDLGDEKRGHEQRGKRYGVVISRTQTVWSTVTVIPTSTGAQPAIFRPQFFLAGRDTKLLIDQIRTIDTDYVIGDPVDYLDTYEIQEVERVLKLYLDL